MQGIRIPVKDGQDAEEESGEEEEGEEEEERAVLEAGSGAVMVGDLEGMGRVWFGIGEE